VKTILPTFSELPRRFRCAATDVLARVNTFSEDSLAGDARHTFFRRMKELLQAEKPLLLPEAREVALSEIEDPVHRETIGAFPLEALERLELGSTAGEVAFAYDVETGECRELGRDLGRHYDEAGRLPTEIVGATDRVQLIGANRIHIGDYKGRSHVTDPGQDEQFLGAALCASRVYRRREVEIDVFPVVGSEIYHRRAVVDGLELDRFELRLGDLAQRVFENRSRFQESGGLDLPAMSEGPWCSWCPSARFCPAKGGMQPAALLARVKEGQALLTPENAPTLYRLKSEGTKLLEQLGAALQLFARQSPFTLENGQTYGVPPDSEERDLLDGRLVETTLKELFGEHASQAVKVTASFSGIERAIRAYRGSDIARGDLKLYGDQAEELLKKRGAMRVIQGGTVRAYGSKTTTKKKAEA
jgi:hypothetical protein